MNRAPYARSRQFGRRRLLGGLTLSGVVSLGALASACGAKKAISSTANGGPASAPRRGGTLTLSDNFQRGFDPHILQATDTGLFGLFYSTLIRANPKNQRARAGPRGQVGIPSQTELVFTLAPNIKWHDKPPGERPRRSRVDDIIYSYQRIQTR